MNPKLQLLRAAPAIHFQDLGRHGVAHHGFSQGGPLDIHAHCWANYLLHNPSTCTTLEISYGNAAFLALNDTNLALTGAEMKATIDGQPCANWASHLLKKGSTLKLNYASQGIHAYLAIQQGFLAPKTLGSTATVIRNSIGEHLKEGATLASNNEAKNGAKPEPASVFKSTPPKYIPNYAPTKQPRTVRIIQPSDQAPELKAQLLATTFTVSPASDRMGMNLIADRPLPSQPGITSEGTSLGTIQLLPDGNAIALLNDRQSQGGYAKIAHIARIDLPILTQSMPGTTIQFKPITLTQATQEWREFTQFFHR